MRYPSCSASDFRYNDHMKGSIFASSDVLKIAKLANLSVTDAEADELAHGFTKTLTVVDALQSVDVSATEPTNQVTGLENVWRDDAIDTTRMFTQEQALSNAKRTHNGFFVVDQILEEK